MNANMIEAQVRDILNSRLTLGAGAESTASSDSGGPVLTFVSGDTLIVRNTFIQMRSHKCEHQTVFDAGLRLRVVGVDNMENICVNTIDNRWKQEKWITTRNFFNLQKKNTQIKMTRSASLRSHSRSLTFDSSAPSKYYRSDDVRTPDSPDFSRQAAAHSRHRSIGIEESFAAPSSRGRGGKAHHRRTMSNKDELRERIRKAIKRRESMDLGKNPDALTKVEPDPRSRSRTVEEPNQHASFGAPQYNDRKMMPPKIKTPSNPNLDRVRQRQDARTPPIVQRKSVPPDSIACPTPRNAWADPVNPDRVSVKRAISVEPGPVGLFCEDWDDGIVESVLKGSQAERLGVRPGWKLIEVGSHPYTEPVLKSFLSGNQPYQIVFLVQYSKSRNIQLSFSEARRTKVLKPSISSFKDPPKPKAPSPSTAPSSTQQSSGRRRKSSVVFCDCDGVLNTAYTAVGEDGLPLDDILVGRVAKLCKEAKANLVLTSTWREDQVAYGKLFRTFQNLGVTVLGRTPSLGSRSAEVLAWLRHNQRHVRNWVVLDDRMELFKEKYDIICPHLVLIDEDEGVTEQDMDFAKTILNPNPVPSVRRKRLEALDASSESAI